MTGETQPTGGNVACLTCEMTYGVGTPLVAEMGPCPDRMAGCCVMHYQYRCPRCGALADLVEATQRRDALFPPAMGDGGEGTVSKSDGS